MNRAQMVAPPLAVAGLVAAALIVVGIAGRTRAPAPARAPEGPIASVVGRPAPEWGERPWLHSAPLDWAALRGRVVLVRFWTDGCPFCAATAPALEDLHRRYGSRGLMVIGVYHPKPPGPVAIADVERSAGALGMTFPLTVDADWSLLERYWLDHGDNGWTSVSFLTDREGIVRHVHPGGEYHAGGGPEHSACREEFAEMERRIEALLFAPGGS
jgi:thiol-disulfide isomerase/thioredoxin